MANATSDAARTYESGVEPVINSHTLSSGFTCFEGAAVFTGATDNEVQAFHATNTRFAGFCLAKATHGTQTHAQVRSRGIIKITVKDEAGSPAGTNTDVGDTVYAEDDSTFTTTATDAIAIGKVHRVLSTSGGNAVCMVYFEAASLASV